MKTQKNLISIIVCSRSKEIPPTLSNNINSTIGDIDYEIVWIDNSVNKYSIFEAYNMGVEKSKGEYLCFMHEDILFHSNNWGEICITELADIKIGILGVIGTHFYSQFSTYWMDSGINHGKIIQGYEKKGKHCTEEWNWNKKDKYSNYVVAIDGLWMCCRKNIFTSNIRFDDHTFKGFHFYDMDFSFQAIKEGYKIKIVNEILIEHTSPSFINQSFTENCLLFHKKWSNILPFQSEFISDEDIKKFERKTIYNLCNLSYINREQQQILNQPLHKLVSKITLLWQKWIK